MSKSIKIFSMILIIFSILISFYGVVHASDINMNLAENVTENENIDETDENAIVDDTSPVADDMQATTDTSTITPPYSVSATAEEGLGLTNILSILLITVGVILILLAIAIIIRLK